MKIAVPIRDYDPNSVLNMQFARSAYFAIIDSELPEIIANPYARESHRTGKRVFEMLVDEFKVDCFAAYELGLKIQQMAVKHNVQMILLDHSVETLNDVLSYRCN